MRLIKASVNTLGTELSHRFPEIVASGNGSFQRQNLLPGSVPRQKGEGKIVPPNGGCVVCRQFILEGKGLNTIPLFYS